MKSMHYIGFDIHKKVIAFCEKQMDGTMVDQRNIPATRQSLTRWAEKRTAPWIGAIEATLFTGWVYDYLLPYSEELITGDRPQLIRSTHPSTRVESRLDPFLICPFISV